MKREKLLHANLILFTTAAIFGIFSGSDEPLVTALRGTFFEQPLLALHNGNSIIFNLSVGYLVSVFIWLLVVYFPEQSRRKVIRDNLSRRYDDFKENTIRILLWCSVGTHESALEEKLRDHDEFKNFFSANDRKLWYAALNGLDGDNHRIKDLVLELELFAGEISYVLNNVNIQNAEVHTFFKRLSEHIYRLKGESVYSYDQVEYLGRFLWEVHACWSFIEGQRKEDVIQQMINTL